MHLGSPRPTVNNSFHSKHFFFHPEQNPLYIDTYTIRPKMGKVLDTDKLGSVFGTRPDILTGIQKAADSPARIDLFNEIATHVYDQLLSGSAEPAHKKRRVDLQQANGAANGTKPAAKVQTNAADESVLLEIKEISVSVPQRKKFELCFTDGHIYARAPNTTAPIPAITYAWSDIGTRCCHVAQGYVLISCQNTPFISPYPKRTRSSTTTSFSHEEHVFPPRRTPRPKSRLFLQYPRRHPSRAR